MISFSTPARSTLSPMSSQSRVVVSLVFAALALVPAAPAEALCSGVCRLAGPGGVSCRFSLFFGFVCAASCYPCGSDNICCECAEYECPAATSPSVEGQSTAAGDLGIDLVAEPIATPVAAIEVVDLEARF